MMCEQRFEKVRARVPAQPAITITVPDEVWAAPRESA